MGLLRLKIWVSRRAMAATLGAAAAVLLLTRCEAPAFGQRVFGLDTSSAANTNVSQAQWNDAYNIGGAGISSFQFAFVRSNHGIPATGGTDDSIFYNNMLRGTNAGLLMGSYNFIEADANTAVEEANHYLARAGMYMKPGYLLPVFDLEGAGSATLSTSALTQWSIDYINAIVAVKGIAPIVYTNSNFNTDEVTAAVAFTNIANSPHTGERTYQWLARPSGNLLTGDPGQASGYPDPYGGWDPNYTTKSASIDPAVKPWAFWQNGSGSPNTFLVDYDAANGNMEFVRDFLVPALWTNAGSGDWGTIANWNSDNPSYNGTATGGPAPRLPAFDATNVTLANRRYDWVKLQNTGGGTVTISSGAQGVRKFYTQQPLNITGGSLTVNYLPGSGGKWDVPSEFNAVVTLSNGASYSAHTTQVDGGAGRFNINGGTVTFRSINLASHASNPGKLVMGGNVTLTPSTLGGTGTAVIRSTGSLSQSGSVDLGAASRTFTISDGSPVIDVSIQAPIIGAGGFTKAGAGTLQLAATNTYTGGTTLSGGTTLVTKDANFGGTPGSAQLANITLDGGTLKSGSELTSLSLSNVGSGYTSFPTVSFGGSGADAVAPTANVLGKISSIQVTAAGSGYTGTAKVELVGGGGTGATATATMVLDSTGVTNKISSITIANQGSGYTSVPTVYITDGSGQGVAGTGAAAAVNGITLTGISLTSSGFDFAAPTANLSGGGGSGAAATAVSSTSLALNANRGISLTANGGTLYQTAGTTLTVGGPISSTGSGTLTKSGPGTLLLNGAGTYTGSTLLSDGILRIGADERLPDTSRVTVNSTLDLNGFTETTGSLEGSGAVSNINVLVTGGDNASTSFSGALNGSKLRKIGTGTMTLSGSNGYSGGTEINGGTLSGFSIANQGVNSSFGTSNFAISNGATLNYAGLNASTNRTISLGTGGGNVVVTGFGSLNWNGVIDGTAFTKAGDGVLTLRAANTYTGGTTVSAGVLLVSGAAATLGTGNVTVQGTNDGTSLSIAGSVTNAIGNLAQLSLLGGGTADVADQGYIDLSGGINEVIGSLLLGGAAQANGITFGSTLSSALIQSDEYFSGTGVVSVGLLGDFNADGSVDSGDYAVWRHSPSTFGGDGAFDLWRAHFGDTAPGAGSSLGAVPEPASIVLVLMGFAAIAGWRRGR